MKTKQTCILLFSRTPEEEIRHKQFVSTSRKNHLVAKALFEESIRLLQITGIPFVVSTEKNQVGSTFGQRFSHAIQSVFDRGYQQVISIGNDCPFITQKEIQKACFSLNQRKAVMGHAKDGGVYLLGLHKEGFDVASFEELAWETERLSTDLLDYFQQRDISINELRTLSDIDSKSMLMSALALGHLAVIRKLKALLQSFSNIFETVTILIVDRNLQPTLRAPPVQL